MRWWNFIRKAICQEQDLGAGLAILFCSGQSNRYWNCFLFVIFDVKQICILYTCVSVSVYLNFCIFVAVTVYTIHLYIVLQRTEQQILELLTEPFVIFNRSVYCTGCLKKNCAYSELFTSGDDNNTKQEYSTSGPTFVPFCDKLHPFLAITPKN